MGLNLFEEKKLQKFLKDKKRVENRYINLMDLDLEAPDNIDIDRLNHLANILRGLIFATVEAGQSGHPGGSSSKVEQMLALILSDNLAFDPINPKNPGRDRLVWSAGHCTPALFSINALIYECLSRSGRQFSEAVVHPVLAKNLVRFRHSDGPQGHAEASYPLSDYSTGPSGHGLSAAGGMAILHKSSGLDTKVYVMMGDAESEEGMSFEARNVLSATSTDNIIVSFDYNHIGIDGPVEEATNSNMADHWRALGWNIIETNGHNVLEMVVAYHLAPTVFSNKRPTVIIAHTLKGRLYGKRENTAASHGSPAKHEEYVEIMKNLGFDIPGIERETDKDISVVLSKLSEEDVRYVVEHLDKSAQKIKSESELVRLMTVKLANRPLVNPLSLKRPETLPKELVFEEGTKVATRKASGAWFKWLMEKTAFFYAGDGDLAESLVVNKAEDVYGIISEKNPLGRGIRFGIAEQNMAMMSAAMTQDVLPGGFKPISAFGTYAVFTTMINNCIRLAVINNHLYPEHKGFFVALAAHDGPDTGEDGPTHQGLYWMSFYNALPGIKVYKPLDANEMIEMLFYALKKGEPVIVSAVRPDTMVIKRTGEIPPAIAATDGAYVYQPFKENGLKKIILAICGPQMLANTLDILPNLEKDHDVKILAVTSPELFEELRRESPRTAYEILPDEERSLVVTLHNGWRGFLYPFLLPTDYDKRSIGIETYLKSGSSKEAYEVAGLTPKEIEEKIRLAEN